jgi:hypothetical protein
MQQQQRQDGMPSCQREGKQKVDMEKGEELEFQDAKRVLEAVYGNSDSDSSDNERRKALHVMFGGFLGHYIPTHRQDLAPRNCSHGARAKSSTAPQVDGDADWVRRL